VVGSLYNYIQLYIYMNFLHSVLFGILSIIIGNIVGFIVGYFLSVDLPKVCKTWNKNYVMELSLFFTGMISFLLYHPFI